MKIEKKFWIIVLATVFFNSVSGSRLKFRPLTASQVYNVLRDAGKEDAVPEGRVVTQGIAAVAGFAAGVTAGIGIPLVLNIDLANVTGILSLFGNQNTATSSGTVSTQSQEICFDSRSLSEIDETASDSDSDFPSARQTTTPTATTMSPTTTATSPSTVSEPTTSPSGSFTPSLSSSSPSVGSSPPTTTGSGSSVNCIVIQKPVRR